jgi:hypothetical protein
VESVCSARRKRIWFVDVGVLGTNAVWTCRQKPTFRRNILPLSSMLKTKAVCSPETLVVPTSLHGITTQKTNIGIFIAVKTSNLIKFGKFIRMIIKG